MPHLAQTDIYFVTFDTCDLSFVLIGWNTYYQNHSFPPIGWHSRPHKLMLSHWFSNCHFCTWADCNHKRCLLETQFLSVWARRDTCFTGWSSDRCYILVIPDVSPLTSLGAVSSEAMCGDVIPAPTPGLAICSRREVHRTSHPHT